MTDNKPPENEQIPEDDEKVGYGNPPKSSRFKKGQSGNPKGRSPEPKNSLNFEECFSDILAKEMIITENGTPQTITLMDAMARRVITDAINGNPAAVRNAFNYLKEYKVGKGRGKQAREDNSVNIRFISGPPGSHASEKPE